jgi:lipid II:glycine glycyltransferase (peptidoglycan interpeptide bridge formation enzyme)
MAADDHSVFMKIDPTEEIGSAGGARPARAIQPRETIILDLEDRPETELMAAMHEKTRYNIRLAARRGVSVVLRPAPVSAQDGEVFWRLMQETTRRDGFRPHPREYYEKMLAARSARFANELVFAEYKGDVVAAAIVNFYRPVAGTPYATYLHGASGREHRDVMAPHLLQWAAIREALRRGCATYDFWGIDARRWPGVTRFKRGFGGREVSCPPSTDIVYRPPWYGLYALAKKGKI